MGLWLCDVTSTALRDDETRSTAHGRNWSPNIGGAEIAENKIKLYLTIVTLNYIDLKEKKQDC
jgi:hypothetical protein